MQPAGTEKQPKPGDRQICIIDDDGSIRTALERLLLSAGFSARTFANARDFLLSGLTRSPVCIISDVVMEGMSGLELSRKLRDDGVDAVFIFLTAHDTPEARRAAMESGGVAYYRKPVDDQALIDAIHWASHCSGIGPRSHGGAAGKTV
jgi:FixJ family two-component response regulator